MQNMTTSQIYELENWTFHMKNKDNESTFWVFSLKSKMKSHSCFTRILLSDDAKYTYSMRRNRNLYEEYEI